MMVIINVCHHLSPWDQRKNQNMPASQWESMAVS